MGAAFGIHDQRNIVSLLYFRCIFVCAVGRAVLDFKNDMGSIAQTFLPVIKDKPFFQKVCCTLFNANAMNLHLEESFLVNDDSYQSVVKALSDLSRSLLEETNIPINLSLVRDGIGDNFHLKISLENHDGARKCICNNDDGPPGQDLSFVRNLVGLNEGNIEIEHVAALGQQ